MIRVNSTLLLGAGILVSVAIVFVVYLLIDGDMSDAVEHTTNRAVGVASGAAAAFVTALVVGLEVLLSAPELLITLLGIGAIVAGISWEAFAATAFVTFLLGKVGAGARS